MIYKISELQLKFQQKQNEKKKFELFIKELQIPKNKVIGIVGESGCGKTTLGKILIGLITDYTKHQYRISSLSGRVEYKNSNILKLKGKELHLYRNMVQMIFQNPRSALNLNMPLKQIFMEIIDKDIPKRKRIELVFKHLEEVSLCETTNGVPENKMEMEKFIKKRPKDLSGGQQRRVGIVKALLKHPEVLIADEPVASLDVSVQGKILDLLYRHHKNEINQKKDNTLILITHNMRIIKELADYVIVMYDGNIIETATKATWSQNDHPHHPYTQHLISAANYLYQGTKQQTFSTISTPLDETDKLKDELCRFYRSCNSSNKSMECLEYNVKEIKFDKEKNKIACRLHENEN